MTDPTATREEKILAAVKIVLTQVVKDTATAPGLKHPLHEETIIGIRDCLVLISQREQELAEVAGREMSMRPRFKDEVRQQPQEVVVSIDSIVRPSKSRDTDKD